MPAAAASLSKVSTYWHSAAWPHRSIRQSGEICATDAKLAQCLGGDLRGLHNQFPAPPQFLNNLLDLMLVETGRRTWASNGCWGQGIPLQLLKFLTWQ
jgi:hypothetical protein